MDNLRAFGLVLLCFTFLALPAFAEPFYVSETAEKNQQQVVESVDISKRSDVHKLHGGAVGLSGQMHGTLLLDAADDLGYLDEGVRAYVVIPGPGLSTSCPPRHLALVQ